MTLTTLKKLGKEWQHILRLDDWRLDVAFAQNEAELDCGSVGMSWVTPTVKQARVRVLTVEQMKRLGLLPIDHDIELTLVHELLHIHVEPWTSNNRHRGEDDPRYIAPEQAIESVALALVGLKRGARIE